MTPNNDQPTDTHEQTAALPIDALDAPWEEIEPGRFMPVTPVSAQQKTAVPAWVRPSENWWAILGSNQ